MRRWNTHLLQKARLLLPGMDDDKTKTNFNLSLDIHNCILTHNASMGFHQGSVDGEISWRARIRLHIDAPFLGFQTKGLQCSLLAQTLHFIYILVTSIIPATEINM